MSRLVFRIRSGKHYNMFVCEAGPELATCRVYEYLPGVKTTPYLDSKGNFVSVTGEPLDVQPRPVGEPFKVNNFIFKSSGYVLGSGSRVRYRVKAKRV